MVGLFYLHLPMSFNIPTQIEKDIVRGKATYETFQTGIGGQTVIPVTPNSYIVIFGYDFSPAGGGLTQVALAPTGIQNLPTSISYFGTQQVSFYNANNFNPFIHHVPINMTALGVTGEGLDVAYQVDNTPIARQVYIISGSDVAVTVGLIRSLTLPGIVYEAIPVTPSTPGFMTYGGDTQTPGIQSTLSPIGALTFTQPQINNYNQYGFAAPFPANAANQAFWVPNALTGLTEPSNFISTFGVDFDLNAVCHYYLNVHYALYNRAIPEQLG
jgi:hypothetical protein